MRPKYKQVQISEKIKLKSGLEEVIFAFLSSENVSFSYETLKITFDQPTQKRTYTPDFPIKKSFIVEAKGNFNSADRKKHKLIKAQHPELDIRFVFQKLKTKVQGGRFTCEEWCIKYNFLYAESIVPNSWIHEKK